jgi:hypothetical protein
MINIPRLLANSLAGCEPEHPAVNLAVIFEQRMSVIADSMPKVFLLDSTAVPFLTVRQA